MLSALRPDNFRPESIGEGSGSTPKNRITATSPQTSGATMGRGLPNKPGRRTQLQHRPLRAAIPPSRRGASPAKAAVARGDEGGVEHSSRGYIAFGHTTARAYAPFAVEAVAIVEVFIGEVRGNLCQHGEGEAYCCR